MLITIASNDNQMKLHHEFESDGTLSPELFINMFVPYLAAKLKDSSKSYHFENIDPQAIKFFYDTLKNNPNLVKAAANKAFEPVKQYVKKSVRKAAAANATRTIN